MSSSMPISGGSSIPISVERAPAVADTGDKSNNDTGVVSSGVSIQNSKELRQAELSGDHVTISDEQVVKSIERANKALQGKNTSVQFSVHEKTKQIMVKVLDKDTGNVIREVPPEKILDLVAKLCEMSGILIDERR